MTEPKYRFKNATRVPPGVTADGVMAERARIVEHYGKATVAKCVLALQEDPKNYPNILAFCPTSVEDALRLGLETGIRKAFSNIIQVKVTSAGHVDRIISNVEVRALYSVKDPDGERVYETINVIANDKNLRNQLLAQLNLDVDTFTTKLKNVIAELQEIQRYS